MELRSTGVLSIWSTDPDPAFTKRLLKTGFKVEEVKARARGGKKGGGQLLRVGPHPQLDHFHRRRRDAVGPIEEVGVVGRATGYEK